MTYYIEKLLAESFEKSFNSYFGTNQIDKIKNRLIEKHGISLSQAIRNFSKFEDVLFDIFGDGSTGVIYNLLEDVCKIKKTNIYMINTIEIRDDNLKYKILESYNDDDKKRILDTASKTAITVNNMLQLVINSTPKQAQQKIYELIYSGLLISKNDDYNTLPDMTKKYSNVVNNVSIIMENDQLQVNIRVKEDLFKSSILKKYASS